MYINSSIGRHTLSLFQKNGPAQSIIVSPPMETAPVVKNITTRSARFEVTDVNEIKAMLDKFGKYMDPVKASNTRAEGIARDTAKKDFYYENGYRNEATIQKQNGASRARRASSGEQGFNTHETAVAYVNSQLKNLFKAAARVSQAATTHAVPEPANGDVRKHSWAAMSKAEAQETLTGMPTELRELAIAKDRHDAVASRLNLDIVQGEAIRDFGISRSVISIQADGSAAVDDFDVDHSEFGKIALVRDGEIFLLNEAGEKFQNSDYSFDQSKIFKT